MGFRYIKDGEIRSGDKINDRSPVMVKSADDLANIEDTCPGMIAHTAGYADMWQLDADGDWVSILGTE